MTTYWLDYHDISTEYDCDNVNELLEWFKDEFADELNGEMIDPAELFIAVVKD